MSPAFWRKPTRFVGLVLCCVLNATPFAATAAPRVLAIYPSAPELPANILRFYIRFSEPMQEMGILQYVTLKDGQNKDLHDAFFENQYELWNQDRTEVTLTLDPGRVKSGLAAHGQLGRAFTPGQRYSLGVNPGLKSFAGGTLRTGFRQSFNAVEIDQKAPDPDAWQIAQKPRPGSLQPLVLDLQEPIDHISALSLIRITRAGKVVHATLSLEANERMLRFKPYKAWVAGTYQIEVGRQLEDLAGNSVKQVFDHRPADYQVLPPVLTTVFTLP